MNIGLEWLAQKFFVACRMDYIKEILKQEPCDVLLDNPEAYFARGPLKVPTQPVRDYIHVSIPDNTQVGIDIRNMGTKRDWFYRVNGEVEAKVPDGIDILEIGIDPQFVEFIFRDKVHTTFQFFVEES